MKFREFLRRGKTVIAERLLLLDAARLLLLGEMRLRRQTLFRKIHDALDGLDRQGRNTRAMLTKLSLEIDSWGEHREEHKRELVALLAARADDVRVKAPVV